MILQSEARKSGNVDVVDLPTCKKYNSVILSVISYTQAASSVRAMEEDLITFEDRVQPHLFNLGLPTF